MYELSQIPSVTTKATQEEPLKVSPELTPDSLASYGVQGLVIATVISLLPPTLNKLFLMFSQKAQDRAKREETAMTAQINQAKILQEQLNKQNAFMQNLLVDARKDYDDALVKTALSNAEVLRQMSNYIEAVDRKMNDQSSAFLTLANFLTQGKPVKVIIETIEGYVKIKPLRDENEPPAE